MSEALSPLPTYYAAAPELQALSLQLDLAKQAAVAAEAGEVRNSTLIQTTSAAVRAAIGQADKRVHEVLDQMFASPGFSEASVLEGLHAVALTKGMGGSEALRFVEGSTALQNEMQSDKSPLVMVVVGGSSRLVCGIADRKAGIGARRADRNLMLNVSLIGVHQSATPEDEDTSRVAPGALYRTGEVRASRIEAGEELHKLWIAGSTDDVERAIDEAARISEKTASITTLQAVELTGIVPIIAYHPEPVAAVLGHAARHVPENRNVARLRVDHLLATGVNIGLSNDAVASIRPDLDVPLVLRERLTRDVVEVTDRFEVISGFLQRTDGMPRHLRPATTKLVMKFVGIGAEEMHSIVGDIVGDLFLRANHEIPKRKMGAASEIAGFLGDAFGEQNLFNAEALMTVAGKHRPSEEPTGPYL